MYLYARYELKRLIFISNALEDKLFCGKLFLHPQETCGIKNRSIILGVTCLCFFYMSNNSFLSSSMHPISIQAFTLRIKESCFSLSQFFSHLWVWMQVLRIYQWFTVLTGLTSDAFVIGSSSLLSCGDGGLRISLKRGITVCTAFLFWNWSIFFRYGRLIFFCGVLFGAIIKNDSSESYFSLVDLFLFVPRGLSLLFEARTFVSVGLHPR